MDKETLRRLTQYVVLGFLIILTLLGSALRVFDNFELDTLDLRFRLRPKIQITKDIVLIEIGNDTIAKLGQFPLDRSYHAVLVNALTGAGAKSIIFDIFFSEPSKEEKSDQEFRDAIAAAGNVYLPYVLDIGRNQNNIQARAEGYAAQSLIDFTEEAKATGHININPDSDGKFRRVPIVIEHNDLRHPYLAFLVSMHHLGVPYKNIDVHPGEYISYGLDRKIPLDEQSNLLVNFSGKWGESYQHYSYVDVLQSYIAQVSGEQPALDLNVFKDKICFIGLTADGTVDLHPTPFETLYPSVGIHAEVFNSIINQNFVARASKTMNLFILTVLSLLLVGLLFKTRPLKGAGALLMIMIFMILLSGILFFQFGLWIDLFYPIIVFTMFYLACTLYRYFLEWKNRLVWENELKIARKIQQSILPKGMPNFRGLDISATMLTAQQVGGDLYDFLEFDQYHLGIMIGDVTGKGVPASLFMTMVAGSFRFFANRENSPEISLQQLNQKLIKESSANVFVTMFYVIFDMSNTTMLYASGGHNPALYVPKDKPAQFLNVDDGLPIGMIDGDYSGHTLEYVSGDIFVFYTDGITEAKNIHSEMYGKKRLADLMDGHRDQSAQKLQEIIERDVRGFEPKDKQQDDITFIVVKII